MQKYGTSLFLLLILVCSLGLISSPNPAIGNEEIKVICDGQALEKRTLPTVGSFEKLKELLATSDEVNRRIMNKTAAAWDMVRTAETAATSDQVAGNASIPDFSLTNTQVRDVDEGDIVKTDGKYIYQVNQNRVAVVLAAPAEKMAVTDMLEFPQEQFYPQELYVDDRFLTVIGSFRANRITDRPINSPELKIYPPVHPRQTTKVLIFDIKDKYSIKKIREVELEGNPVSSRKVGSCLYLATNKYLDYYRIMEDDASTAVPYYRDSAIKDDYIEIPFREICYFPGKPAPNYLLVGGLDLNDPHREMKVAAYLGAGENIYATRNNLYVAVTQYESRYEPREDITAKRILPSPVPENTNTLIYKFSLKEGNVNYSAEGTVPGTILNQFSMDEYQGYFRIATTTGHPWREDEYTSKNNIYILDDNMKLTGKIEDIAPGERIYSVRFMGNRGYMVTFKKVDPLFVIDLQDPKDPKILGALKIPGYSDYLHPYDDNHIIGFGKDTVEISQKDAQGNELGTTAFYQGMKIALFDVSDVTRPIQKFQEIIGDRGTESELLRNHKALLFSREKNLLAFPVTVTEIKNKNLLPENVPAYGEFVFQGAYVYRLDLTQGFSLRGTITHLHPEDLAKAGNHWYNSNNNIERIIYIGDTLYTLSKETIKAHNLHNLQEIKTLHLPQ